MSTSSDSETNSPPRYPCLFCDKTFPTPMAMGGHQNAHRKERAGQKRIFLTPNGISLVTPSSSSSSSSSGNCRYFRELSTERQIMLAHLSAPLAPPPPPAPLAPPHPPAPLAPPPPQAPLVPTGPPSPPPSSASTMFFGVPDFFGPSVAPEIPPGDGANSSVQSEEEEEDKDLDLDLKL